MADVSSRPPRAPPIRYHAPVGTRWAKETAAAGGVGAFDLPTDPKLIGPWILGECVGKGASGRVKIAKHRVTGQLAAVKILPLDPLVNSRTSLATQQAKSDQQRLGIDREITMMKLMNHPNILRIYDVYEGAKELFLVLEYVEGGELFDFLVNRGHLPADEAREYFKQIVYGLNYAHTFSIIHRDLKPENILIASLSPPLIKIADWGMAAFAPPLLQLETSCGSPHYASPEIVNGERYQGNATDIWSCGVILYALLTGRLPFDDKNVKVLLSKVKSGKFEMPDWLDPFAIDLLSRMLVVDVSCRITIPELLAHPWLRSNSKGLRDRLRPSPNPPLPPSPSTLARPLEHPSLIDPELLSSLRIIWGRHADPQGESIKRDLCAPAGKGDHAKAFYFLLGRYRDEYLQARDGVPVRTNSHASAAAIDGMDSMGFNLGWDLDGSATTKQQYSVNSHRLLNAPNSRASASPHPPRGIDLRLPQDHVRTPGGTSSNCTSNSRRRLPENDLPDAPRRPLARAVDPAHRLEEGIPTPEKDRRSDATTSSAAAPPQFLRQPPTPRVRSRTVTPSVRPPRPPPVAVVRAPEPAPPKIHAPIAIAPPVSSPIVDMDINLDLSLDLDLKLSYDEEELGASEHDLGEGAEAEDEELPLLTAPRTTNAELQKTMDAVAERLNGLVRARAASSPPLPPLPPVHRRHTNRAVSRPVREDKENRSVAEEGWSYVAADEYQGVGLGVGGVDVKMGKEMGNVVFLPENADSKAKKDKERKGKHTTLPPLRPKRSTISLLASPIVLSSVMNHHPPSETTTTGSRLTSPVVGEFKGWFSNLFSWKGSHPPGTGVIYSPDGLEKTRREVGLLIERLGIVVEGSGFSFPEGAGNAEDDFTAATALRCKVEEASSEGTAMVLKPVKFRIEFSAAPSHRNHFAQLSPNPNAGNLPSASLNALLAAPLDPPLKNRASVLVNRTASANTAFPPGCQSAIVLVHEKGSASTFKNVWKKLKEVYASGAGAGYPILSPAMGATPFIEQQPQRFAL
ncbi:hypothetical protein DFH06DRAFT_1470402 [Mycena polygramma]|nr:hypothetical protein DFH06DRAFT_1470402 [Mycena polygramma]